MSGWRSTIETIRRGLGDRSPMRIDVNFRGNPHLYFVYLALPLALIAVIFEMAWPAFAALGIWLFTFILHIFMGKKPDGHRQVKW